MNFSKKLLALICMLTASLSATPTKGPCACKDCKCTQEKHCGCFSYHDKHEHVHQKGELKQNSSINE